MKTQSRVIYRLLSAQKLYARLTDEAIQKPFFAIFVWTVFFRLTVVLTVAVRWSIGLPRTVGSAER